MTFEDLRKDPVGTIYVDREEDGVRFIIVRSGASLCAYVGAHKSTGILEELKVKEVCNKLLGEVEEQNFDILCHGGITYEGIGESTYLPEDYYFLGWDYAHAGDAFLYDFQDMRMPRILSPVLGKQWTPEMVDRDSQTAVKEFKKIMKRIKKAHKKPLRSISFD